MDDTFRNCYSKIYKTIIINSVEGCTYNLLKINFLPRFKNVPENVKSSNAGYEILTTLNENVFHFIKV